MRYSSGRFQSDAQFPQPLYLPPYNGGVISPADRDANRGSFLGTTSTPCLRSELTLSVSLLVTFALCSERRGQALLLLNLLAVPPPLIFLSDESLSQVSFPKLRVFGCLLCYLIPALSSRTAGFSNFPPPPASTY